MNQRHPIDDIFYRKLRHYASEPPMHLWAGINQKRNWGHKIFNKIRLSWLTFGLLVAVFGASFLFLKKDRQLEIRSFPIPLIMASPTPTATAFSPAPVPGPAVAGEIVVPSFVRLQPARPLPTLEASPIVAKTAENQLRRAFQSSRKIIPPAHLPMVTEREGLPLEAALFSHDPKCAKFEKGHWRLFLDAMVSADVQFRNLSPKNSEFDYVQRREETESSQLSFSTALRLSAVSGFGLAIRSGLNYSQINEKFNYVNENEERITITTIFGPDGEIIGTDTIVETGKRVKVTHNRLRTLDIPILLGYELSYEKLTFTINGGAYLNLTFRQKGDFLSPYDLRPVSFSSGQPGAFQAFKSKLGIGWYASVGALYQLNHGLQLLVEPHFNIYPQSVTLDQYIAGQKYFNVGMFLGIRRQF